MYHTVLHIGTKNADGIGGTEVAPVIAAIWSDFTDLDVRRRDGTLMKYWGSPSPGFDAIDLLRDADGTCGAWARMFRDVFLAQGVPAESRGIVQGAIPGYRRVVFRVDDTLPGQGNPDPPYIFPDHGLVIVGGRIYDPSYGRDFGTLSEWEDACLEVMIYQDLDDPERFLIKANTVGVQDMEWLPY